MPTLRSLILRAMSNNPKSRSLKRSGSDSGISNDSAEIKVNEIAKPMGEKPKIFQISISACGNSKRAVNGKELVLPQVTNILSDEESFSSEEEGEIFNSDSDNDAISGDYEALNEDDDVKSFGNDSNQRIKSDGQDATVDVKKKPSICLDTSLDISDISDDEEWAWRRYWERDVIDTEIITSKNKLFRYATMLPESLINMELSVPCSDLSLPVPVPVPCHPAIDDDVISLHPDDMNFDSNKIKSVFKQPNARITPLLAGKESRDRPLPSSVSKKAIDDNVRADSSPDAPPKVDIFLKPAQSTRPTTVGTRALKRASSSACDTFVPNKRLLTATSSTSPTPLVLGENSSENRPNVPSLFDVRVPPPSMIYPPPTINLPPMINPSPSRFEPIAKPLAAPLLNLCQSICWYYDRCLSQGCNKYHQFTPDLFHGSAEMQVTAWTRMKTRFSQLRPNIIRDIVRSVPAVLAETKHEELLLIILRDLMVLDNVYNRDVAVKEIVFALLQIRSDGGRDRTVNFGTIIDHIFATSHCYELHTHPQSTMCAYILSLTTEQDDFMQYWPIVEKLFPFVAVALNRGIVARIVGACRIQQVSEHVKKSVMNMLLEPRLVVQSEETLTFVRTVLALPECDDAVSQPGSSVPSEWHAPCVRGSSRVEGPPGDEFMECDTAEQLDALLRRNCAERCWKSMVHLLNEHLHKIDNADVPIFLNMFKEVLTDAMLDDIDEKHRTLLMVLVVAVLIYLRENPVMNNSQYKIGASLIGHFEHCLSEFHELPVYNDKYKDNTQLLILSRLIYGCNFKLALRWMQTSKFKIPQMSPAGSPNQSSKDFQWFYRIMKQLFDGFYQSKSLDDCKDLIIVLFDGGFDEDAQRGAQEKTENNASPWCMMDYFKAYVRETVHQWHCNVRNILEDESIFRFYNHLHLQDLRNVAILMYIKKPAGIAFTKFAAMIESCPEFYKFEDDVIIYNDNYSVVEIQLVTHIFFHKFYLRNRAPHAVRADYEELKSAKACPPKVLTSSVWDTEAAIRKRVQFALRAFAPLPIKRFDGTFKIGDVKLILEQIRRRNAT